MYGLDQGKHYKGDGDILKYPLILIVTITDDMIDSEATGGDELCVDAFKNKVDGGALDSAKVADPKAAD